MISDLQNALLYAHRTNIDRWRRLLKTNLTNHERDFIATRLGEEESALLEITKRTQQGKYFDAVGLVS